MNPNMLMQSLPGPVANTLMRYNFDPGCLRPWLADDDPRYAFITVNGENIPVNNTNVTLRKLDWIELDRAVVKAAKERLRLVADLRAAGLTYNIPNGMSKTVLETERQSDISAATMSMDGLRKGNADRPVFDLAGLPLPIIHKDFDFSARQVMASRNGGSPLDVTTAELASRRVAEYAEDLAIGAVSGYSFAGGTIYGLTTFPSRITAHVYEPTETGWDADQLISDVLRMRQLAYNKKHYGPFVLYTSLAWDEYLDKDYVLTGGNVATQTIRERLRDIQGIQDVVTLDRLSSGFRIVLVQQTTDVIREVIGLDFTTVSWQEQGGLQLNFKVMAILVPQLRADINGNTGIVDGATSLSE